jgi:hypothetical protein
MPFQLPEEAIRELKAFYHVFLCAANHMLVLLPSFIRTRKNTMALDDWITSFFSYFS